MHRAKIAKHWPRQWLSSRDKSGNALGIQSRRGRTSSTQQGPSTCSCGLAQSRSSALRLKCYLIRRGLAALIVSPALRFRPDTPHPEGGRYPALIALIQNVDGIPTAIHRTFLTRDGRKANAVPVKASLGAIWGGAIRLQAIEPGKPLVIGEGLEIVGVSRPFDGPSCMGSHQRRKPRRWPRAARRNSPGH